MDNIYNYIFYNSITFVSFLALEYISDPENIMNNLKTYSTNAIYWSFDKYISISMLFDKESIDLLEESESGNIEFLAFNEKGILVEKDSEDLYRIFRKTSNNTMKMQNNYDNILNVGTFFNFEVTLTDDKIIDLTKEMNNFNIEGNILDNVFFKAFLKKNNNIDLNLENDDYSINVFNDDFRQLYLNKNNRILFLDNKVVFE